MGNKSVDRAEMNKAAQQIDTKHQQIQAPQTRLRGEMQQLAGIWTGKASTAFQQGYQRAAASRHGGEMQQLAGIWTGKASTAFQQGYQRFDEEYEKVKQGLEKIHVALTETLRDYTIREDESESEANKFIGSI